MRSTSRSSRRRSHRWVGQQTSEAGDRGCAGDPTPPPPVRLHPFIERPREKESRGFRAARDRPCRQRCARRPFDGRACGRRLNRGLLPVLRTGFQGERLVHVPRLRIGDLVPLHGNRSHSRTLSSRHHHADGRLSRFDSARDAEGLPPGIAASRPLLASLIPSGIVQAEVAGERFRWRVAVG